MSSNGEEPIKKAPIKKRTFLFILGGFSLLIAFLSLVLTVTVIGASAPEFLLSILAVPIGLAALVVSIVLFALALRTR